MCTLKNKRVLFILTGLFLVCGLDAKAELIGYWPLNETAGITATNLADGGTIGILTNGPTWILNDPQRGRVLSFDGVDDHVIAGSIPALGVTSKFTWSFWAYNLQDPNNNVILGNRYDAESKIGSDWIKFTPSKFEYQPSNGNIDYVNIPKNQWIHHAVVKSGTNICYFRNGSYVTNTSTSATMPIRPFYMGGDRFGEYWQGRIDDVAIWTDALPTNSIAGLADGTLTPLTAPAFPVGIFDLADTVGGGDGSLPGTGGGGDLSPTPGTYTTYPANSYVDGTFAPNTNSTAIVIDGAGHTYDFNGQTSNGSYPAWYNGLNMDTDPSNTNGLPNFTGDPENHSLLSGHANKGITFDLEAIRNSTGRSIEHFTAYIGDSIPKQYGTISYFVFVDGVLITNRFHIRDAYDFVTVDEVFTGRYLTIAICDSNDSTNSDHGFIGDPFLSLIPYTEPEPPSGTIIMIL
ncbi:MAG: LamG domain-containing protein [Kiritimatiellae bacterium]|jgi:hypothetical protein|nr:LamG domain-containing protein [Kiritimatiellia bacterium]